MNISRNSGSIFIPTTGGGKNATTRSTDGASTTGAVTGATASGSNSDVLVAVGR